MMTIGFAELLKRETVWLDGAWGTQLQARGLKVGECPDLWNLENPEAVLAVAKDYAAAGSMIILTNTFGASRPGLKRHGRESSVQEINQRGAELSKQGAGEHACVFASIGPNPYPLFMGDIEEAELSEIYEEQARALALGGVDGLVIETMSDPKEACLAIRAAKKTNLPVVGCMVFDTGPDRDRTMTGCTPEDAVHQMIDAGADIVGSNCGNGIEGMLAIATRMRKACEVPLWIKANAGLPVMKNGQAVYETQALDFSARVPSLQEAGVQFIGGCCGTSPDFIRALTKS